MISITVITCTFNASKAIERTLQSVLEQEYDCVEHLLIDGKSKDNTCELIERYIIESEAAANGHAIRFISEPDKGLYDAMNKGLQMAAGEYLVFLNAGDTFPSSYTLQQVANVISEGEPLPGVIYGDTDIVDEDGRFLRHRHYSAPDDLSWKSFLGGMLVCHQAFYALTDIARVIPYNISYRYSADVDWCIRVMKESASQGRPLRNTHQVLANFLDGGMSTTNHKASLKERFRVMARHYGLLPTIVQHCRFVLRAVMIRVKRFIRFEGL